MNSSNPPTHPAPRLRAPKGHERIDCHVHVLDPQRFPYAADTRYRPLAAETGSVDDLGHVLDAHGVSHALIVGPNSGYGQDNRCLLDALARGAGRYKGVAVLANDASRMELQDLQAAGVVGVAFNPALLGVDHYLDTGPLLERLRDLGMWAQFQVQADQLVRLAPMLGDSGARLLFDHCGRPDPRHGVAQAGFEALLAFADTGRACVKLSSLTKCSASPFPHPDAWGYVQALVQAYTPDALVWASDWPFLRAPARIDYGPVLALFEQLLPDPAVRRAIWWDTPRRLFGFGDRPWPGA
ncbi:MAG: amidohydrolase family protein [Rubrivivax sp.]|nr:amidohydrolase family protein [Rubrivivax sp.]